MRSMATSNEYAQRALELMPGPHSNLPGYELFRPIWITRGEGAHLWDADGNEYFDYMCGLGAGTMGYGNRVVLDAVAEQLYRLPYLDAARRHPEEIALAEKIIEAPPGGREGALPPVGDRGLPARAPPGPGVHRAQPLHPLRRPLPRLAGQHLRGRRGSRPPGPSLRPLPPRRPLQLEGPRRGVGEAVL